MSKIKLKIILVHNYYRHYGGEDSVFKTENDLLKANGNVVVLYTKDNKIIERMSALRLFIRTIWSFETYREISKIIVNNKPDIIHVHNFFPLISPSIYWVAKKHKIPILQTVHNFRLSCLQATFMRNNKTCELCISKIPWRGVMYKCYRNSYAASTVLALMLIFHRVIGTFRKQVTAYIALNDYCKDKLIEMGIPREHIQVKSNSVSTNKNITVHKKGNPLFVGRLSEEKGISILAQAIKKLTYLEFDIIGDGPMRYILEDIPNVRVLGELSKKSVLNMMYNAPFTIIPSMCSETMSLVLAESYGCSTPVIASKIGALQTLVEDKKTGLHFKSGSAIELADAIAWAVENKEKMAEMGKNAKSVYKKKYSHSSNYKTLMDIYMTAINN